MERFTEKLLNFDNLSLFHLLKGYRHPNEIWKILDYINSLEIASLKDGNKQKQIEALMRRVGITNSKQVSRDWMVYRWSQETEALFLFLFSNHPQFLDNYLKIKGEEYLKKLSAIDRPIIFISPHWGAFYSIPIILSALHIVHTPLANGGEEEHLKRVLNTLIPEQQEWIRGILSTKHPVLLIKELRNLLEQHQNLLVYPEYTAGGLPKTKTSYFGELVPAPRGIPKLTCQFNALIQPLSLRRVPQSSQFEMTFYPPIFPEQCQYQAVTVGDSIHARIETIVKQDPSQWWYWEIFETTRHLLRGE